MNSTPARPILEHIGDPFDSSFYKLDLNALSAGVLPTGTTVTLTRDALYRLHLILDEYFAEKDPFDIPIGDKECDETTCEALATHRDARSYAWCETHREVAP
jgi:hypothetical protein